MTRADLNEEIEKIERDIRRRLPIGWSTSYASLVREFVNQQGYSQHSLERTLMVLDRREVIRFSNQRKTLHRIGATGCSAELHADLVQASDLLSLVSAGPIAALLSSVLAVYAYAVSESLAPVQPESVGREYSERHEERV